MNNMNEPGYESLAQVLQEAYDQAARGKGAERHANDLPFDQQPMQQIARRRGLGFLLGYGAMAALPHALDPLNQGRVERLALAVDE